MDMCFRVYLIRLRPVHCLYLIHWRGHVTLSCVSLQSSVILPLLLARPYALYEDEPVGGVGRARPLTIQPNIMSAC